MTSTRKVVTGPDVPSGIGPYSPAVRGGDFLFVSGQPGVDPGTAEPAGLRWRASTSGVAEPRCGATCGGSRPELVVNTTVLVADSTAFAELNELYAEFFPSEPARMTMQVPRPRGLLISIGCVALVES